MLKLPRVLYFVFAKVLERAGDGLLRSFVDL